MPKSSKRRSRAKTGTKTRNVAPVAKYVPTPAEHAALAKVIAGLEHAAYAPAKVAVEGSVTQLGWHHPSDTIANALWAHTLGTSDFSFAATLFDQLAQVARTGPALTDKDLNQTLALVRGLAPTDPTEALLATQMAAIHNATMVAARRLAHVDNIEQQDSASAMLNKLARTFALQIAALKGYRLKGEQTIKVQHVTVNDGGQAIVGNVQHAPGGILKNERQSHELSGSHAHGPALLRHLETHQVALPGPGGEGPARVPVPRRARRGAPREKEWSLPPRPLHESRNPTAARRRPTAS